MQRGFFYRIFKQNKSLPLRWSEKNASRCKSHAAQSSTMPRTLPYAHGTYL